MTTTDFGQIISNAAKDAGVELAQAKADVTQYAAQRAAVLQGIQGEMGFDEAVKAEALAVVLFAAGRAVDQADANDQRVWGVVIGLLSAAATAGV